MFATLFVLFNTVVMTASTVVRSPHILPETAVFDDTIKCMPAFTYYTLSLMAIVPLSVFISVVVTSQIYRRNLLEIIGSAFNKPNDEPEEEEPEEQETPEEKYTKLYPIKRATHDPSKCLDELKYTIMVETTPKGTVLMCYNHEAEGFEYWCDTDIPLTMLETAARRYVTEYNCKQFYLPRKKTNVVDKEDEIEPAPETEPEPAPEIEPAPETEPEPVSDTEDNDVFIKRKKTATQVKLEKQIAEEEPVTRFVKKGKLADFKPKELFKGMNFDEQIVKKTLNYDMFKKAMMETISADVGSAQKSRMDYASVCAACDEGTY
jgi:hypothetical protein